MRPWGVRRLFRFSQRSPIDVRADIEDEVRFHLDMRINDLVRDGMPAAAARDQAQREFGATVASSRRLVRLDDRLERRRRVGQLATELFGDMAFGLRLLIRGPGFAAVAILTLALGIGANTAIYSALDAVLLRPLPYPEPHRLAQISETQANGNVNSTSGGAFLDWRSHQTQFAALTLTGQVAYNLRGAGVPERLSGMEVSHEFLSVLGIAPLLGRGFLPEEDRPGGPGQVVLITEALWRTRFGADPAIVGRTIVLDEVPRTVIGVLPEGAWLFKKDSFFVPAVLAPGTPRAARSPHWATVFGRLASGATIAQADAELKAIKQQLNAEYPAFKQVWGVRAEPITEVIGSVAQAPLLILVGAVSVVLLIACANVANLLLARGCQREQELAVRAALGASSGRLVRQVLAENLTLAVLGGLAGLALAYLGVGILARVMSESLPIAVTPRVNPQVLLFSLLITLATAPLVGLLPALRARRPDLTAPMNTGSKGTPGAGRPRTQAALMVAEVALTVVLLASAGLLLRSLARTASSDTGFDPSRALAFDVSLPDASYTTADKRLAFATELVNRLRTLPGVEAAGSGMAIPFSGGGYGEFFRRPDDDGSNAVTGRMDFVSPGYLEALGTRLLAGRRFNDADNRADGARVMVISAATAHRFFPEGDPLGRPLSVSGRTWQIVGVIADVVDRRLDVERRPFAYVPRAFNMSAIAVVVRTGLDPESLVGSVRAEMARLDPGVALANPRVLDRAMTDSMAQRRVVLGLVFTFATAALVLAAIGLYGVMAYGVATRRREFGIRMAFGATSRGLIGSVLGAGLRVVGVGVLLGLAGAIGVARLMASELYQVSGSDPLVIGTTAAIVAVVALLACWIPARRASRLEPMAALRAE